jgi:ABC-type multidrug transport system ATPase subunit
MTIHQPNSETFELFDDLMVMLEGKLIYQSAAAEVTDYF